MKPFARIIWGLLSYVILSSALILATKVFFSESGTIRVSVNYRSLPHQDISVFWNSGNGFSGKDQISQTTTPNNIYYNYKICNVDSLLELRIDPDGKFDTAAIYEVSVSGLVKPVHFFSFNGATVNGLNLKQNDSVCNLTRLKNNNDPYILLKIPVDSTKVDKTLTKQDLFFFTICLVISGIFIWLVKDKIFNFLTLAKTNEVILFLFFYFLVLTYWSNSFLKYYKTPASIENRTLSPKPLYAGLETDPKRYFIEFTSWFSDHYPFKQMFVHANSWIKINLFKTSPMPGSMYIGKKFQFFTANELLRDDITGKRRLSEEELSGIVTNTLLKKKYLADQNIAYYLTIPPSKQTVYEDLLPTSLSLQRKGIKMAKQLENEISKLQNDVYINVIDLLVERHLAYPKEHVFYQYDIHWSDWGAFLAYQKLINALSAKHEWVGKALNIDDLEIDTIYDESADLAKLILMQKSFKKERYIFRYKDKDSIEETIINGVFAFPIYKYKNPKAKGKLLVFRDSYSEQWKQLIARHFNESVFIWDQNISQKLIDEYKPDIVIQENCEMFLFYLFNPIITRD